MHDRQLGLARIVVHVARRVGEIAGFEIAGSPDLADALVDLLLGAGRANGIHLVVDDLVEGWLCLEAVLVPVVLQEPRFLVQPLQGALDQSRVVAASLIRSQHGEQQLRQFHPTDDPLRQIVHKDRHPGETGVGRLAAGDQQLIRLGSVRGDARLRADDVRLTNLLELGAVQAAGQVLDDRLVCQIDVVRVNQPGPWRSIPPQLAHDCCQEAQRAARALKVGDRRHAQVEHPDQLGVEWVCERKLVQIVGAQRPLVHRHVLRLQLPIVRSIAGDGALRPLAVHALKETVDHDGRDLVLVGGGQHSLLSCRHLERLGQCLMECLRFLAKGVDIAGHRQHDHDLLLAGGKLEKGHQKAHRLVGQVGLACRRRCGHSCAQVACDLVDHDQRGPLAHNPLEQGRAGTSPIQIVLLSQGIAGTSAQLVGQLPPQGVRRHVVPFMIDADGWVEVRANDSSDVHVTRLWQRYVVACECVQTRRRALAANRMVQGNQVVCLAAPKGCLKANDRAVRR